MAQKTRTHRRSDLGPRVPIFALNGPTKGPRLVVTGPDTLVRAVADLMWDRRDLSTIKGTVLLRAEGQDTALDRPDAVLALEGTQDDAPKALFYIFDHIAALGMMPMEVETAA